MYGSHMYNKIEAEAKQNAAFRMAVIGAVLAVVGALLTGGFLLFTSQKKTPVLIIVVVNLVLTTLAMALAVYTNYCVTHGGCDTLATVYGVFYLIAGIVSLVAAIMNGLIKVHT